MPQFDFATYSSQIFWLLLCFGIFFTYIKFYFLPKLENILIKRNQDIALIQKEIEQNNKEAKANFAVAEHNIKEAQKLADSIIADAEAEARIHEGKIISQSKQIQQDAIEKIIADQRNILLDETFRIAINDVTEIVLKNIGMHVNSEEIQQIVSEVRAKN